MARFGSCRLIPNLMPRTLNTLLRATTIQDEDAVIVVESDAEAENVKS